MDNSRSIGSLWTIEDHLLIIEVLEFVGDLPLFQVPQKTSSSFVDCRALIVEDLYLFCGLQGSDLRRPPALLGVVEDLQLFCGQWDSVFETFCIQNCPFKDFSAFFGPRCRISCVPVSIYEKANLRSYLLYFINIKSKQEADKWQKMQIVIKVFLCIVPFNLCSFCYLFVFIHIHQKKNKRKEKM